MSYSQKTGLVYIPVIDYHATYSSGGLYFGARVDMPGVDPDAKWEPGAGKLVAWDPVARGPRWSVDYLRPMNGGVLSTGGNLVFQGTATGDFHAYAADSGRRLWSRKTGSSIQAQPVTYRVGGEQYVLASIGGKGGGAGLGVRAYGESPDARGPARLLAFKLGGDGEIPLPPQRRIPVPRPPARTASAEQVEQGRLLFDDLGCASCHGWGVFGMGERKLEGAIPDLRYIPASVHEEWHGVVLGGNRAPQGMPSFQGIISVEDSEALHAYVIEQAWKLYEHSENVAPR